MRSLSPCRAARRSLAALLLPAALAGCSGAEAARAGGDAGVDPTAVRLAAVSEETVAPPVVATGTVAARDEITLSFKIGGILRSVLVSEGDVVRAGQPLATLDLREIDAQVAKARSGAAKAERDLARAGRLYGDSVVTLAQHQDAATAADVARADLEAATFNRRYASIVAPADGPILRRAVEPGEVVSPGAPVLVLGSRASGTVLDVGLADRDLVRVRPGDRATVTFDAFPGRTVPGTVQQVGAAASPLTGTYRVRLALDGAAGLATGMVGRAEIQPGSGERLPVIPVEALVEADGSRGVVFTLDGSGRRAKRVDVELAFVRGPRVAVRRGLEGVREVVAAGAHYLDDGAAVRVLP